MSSTKIHVRPSVPVKPDAPCIVCGTRCQMFARPGQRPDRCAVPIHRPRREWLLTRLREADGPSYDELCRESLAAFPPEPGRIPWPARAQAVRAVRLLLWHGLAATEADETVWLTPAGWQAAGRLPAQAGAVR